MSRRRPLGRRDDAEQDIVAELRHLGISVYLMDDPLDALCCYRGTTFLVEFKTPKAQRRTPKRRAVLFAPIYEPNLERLPLLTDTQRDFVATWPGPWVIAKSSDEVMKFCRWLM